MQVAFLIAELDMDRSRLDEHDFVLPEVLVPWYLVSKNKVFRSQHLMLRTIVFRADFQHWRPPRFSQR